VDPPPPHPPNPTGAGRPPRGGLSRSGAFVGCVWNDRIRDLARGEVWVWRALGNQANSGTPIGGREHYWVWGYERPTGAGRTAAHCSGGGGCLRTPLRGHVQKIQRRWIKPRSTFFFFLFWCIYVLKPHFPPQVQVHACAKRASRHTRQPKQLFFYCRRSERARWALSGLLPAPRSADVAPVPLAAVVL
jgi:hypothetical protein